MNLTLSLLLPLAVGHGPAPAGCANGSCPAPAARSLGPFIPGPMPAGPAARVACPPSGPPAPVLTATVVGPAGSRVTFFAGGAGKSFPAPVTAGFRPGYAYRFEVANLPGHPGEALYPVLEVRGSLVPRPTMKPTDYPAPIVITKNDIDKAMAGVMVTKVIYLENPERAVPAPSKPLDPLEVAHDSEEDAVLSAKESGRLVAVLRFGDRRVPPDELTQAGVPGTVLFPGEGYLSAPGVPPCLPWVGVPLWDPILGPRVPSEECLTDGGDKGPQLGIAPDGRIGGLNPTDVGVEYTQNGVRKVATSNEVCLCVPRFGVRRVDQGVGRFVAARGLELASQAVGRSVVSNNTPPLAVAQREKPIGVVAMVRPQLQIGEQRVDVAAGLTRVAVRGTAQGVLVIGSVVEPDEITSFPNQLTVTKSVDPAGSVKVGDVVTFTIRFRNNTRVPVTDLVVNDSLSGRLEYVPGSAASDRPANVTTVENEAGSVVVRAELPGALAPGQGGVITFRAKVR